MRRMIGLSLGTCVLLCLGVHGISLPRGQAPTPEKPIWAAEATALDLRCEPGEPGIQSPDHQLSARVVCTEHKGMVVDTPVTYETYSLRVIARAGGQYEAPLGEGAHELLWAPNSRMFLVNGSENSNSGFFVDVYQIENSGIRKLTITGPAQKDMVKSFPPCKAWNRDEATCAGIASDPEFNMSGLAWTKDSSAILVFAEVPCDSLYGGIMCQVRGYVLNALDGSILRRLSASQTKQQWGKYAAWSIRIPEPPKYGPANLTP